MLKIIFLVDYLEIKPWKFSSTKIRQKTKTGRPWMMQNWAQYVKKTVRFHPKAEDLPQQLTGSQHQHLQQQQQ